MKDDNRSLDRITQMIHDKEPFHIQIPIKNKLVFNKVVPYIFVYRQRHSSDPMLSEMVKAEFAHFAIKDPTFDASPWLTTITQQLAAEFGSCLVVEGWVADEDQSVDIQINISRKQVQSMAQYLEKQLNAEEGIGSVKINTSAKMVSPPGTAPLFDIQHKNNNSLLYIGLSIRPSYLTAEKAVLPIALRYVREALSRSLSKTFFEFLRIHTSFQPASFKVSGSKDVVPLVWEIDQKLAKESQRFDFLLLVTPLNAYEAWLKFKKDNYRKTPLFKYRPMPIDPDMVKRNLYNLPIEELYDPTIAYLFRDKRKELDHMMSMLSERGKEGFMHGSLLVFGHVNEKLLDTAKAILTITENIHAGTGREEDVMFADEFAGLALQEIEYLKLQDPSFDTTVRVRDDIYGVMVNQGVLNISKHYSVPRRRAKALIQHEVGTHIVTYYNGKHQPFNLFKLGVPGYEKLQEGLAVLAEFMVGGLSNDRLRIIAGRVVAVHYMLLGNTFIDTFSLLAEHYNFEHEVAFQITMRVFRSGGLTKDALYLKGLIDLVSYIKKGSDLNLLTMGKIREDYIPIVQELLLKGVLRSPVLTPRYLTDPYIQTLTDLKAHKGVFQMIH